MSERQEFLKECKEVRNNFVAIAGQYSVGEHLKLRTEIDTLLIMYDQLCERVRLADSSYDSSGLHKHGVNARTLGFVSCATLAKSMPLDQAIQIIKSDITGLPKTAVIDGELVVQCVR